MRNGRKIVGFDRKLELDWLDAAAAQVAQGASSDEVRAYLWKLLEGSVSAGSSGFNSDRGKTITVLVHVWADVPERARPLRERALKLLQEVDPAERLCVHWAMCMATYSFFQDVATTVGRFAALHERVRLSDVRARLAERWGDRDITRRASQRIIRSFVAWGVLADTEQRGAYHSVGKRITAAGAVGEVLLEGLLVSAERGTIPIERILGHPALFPFELDVPNLRRSAHFVVDRQGVDLDLVRLAPASLGNT